MYSKLRSCASFLFIRRKMSKSIHWILPLDDKTGPSICRTRKQRNSSLPLVDTASLISQRDGDGPRLAEVKVLAVVMVVGRDPAHPHRRRVLSGEHPHRVVILRRQKAARHGGSRKRKHSNIFRCFSHLFIYLLKPSLTYRGDASVVSTSIDFGRMTVKIKAMQEDVSFELEGAAVEPALASPESERLVQEHVHGVKLHGHAQPTVKHVAVAVLCTKRLVGHLEAGRTVHCSVDPSHLTSPDIGGVKVTKKNPISLILLLVLFSPRCERGPGVR